MPAQVLRRLIRELAGSGTPLQPHLRQFLLQRCAGGVCLAGLARSGFDTRRAALESLTIHVHSVKPY